LSELLDIATQTIELARKAGATGAECTCSEGENFSVDIRLNEVETLTQSASRAAGLRVMVGQFTGSSYTSDLTREGLAKLVASAMELAAVTTEDPLAGLPDPQDLGSFQGDLDLFSDDIERLAPQDRIEMALRAERAAMEFDPRITNSDGAGFSSFRGVHAFANSLQFAGEYRSSYCSISCVPVAKQGEKMERDYWSSSARGLAQLESPEHVGQTAAERTVRRLGAVKAVTQKAVVIFEPRVARSFAGSLFEAIEGRAIYRDSSFLNGKLGEKIASLSTNLVDDGTMPRLFGSQPFDDEGVATRRTVVIRNGVLETYLLNTYSARKLGMRTTGNASRGITGNAGVGHGNFYLEAGQRSPGELIRSLSNGFYVTELIGSGVNISTGDYSRGATGLWIENGQLTYPVSEVTIAGTLQEMLASLEPANDLEFRSSVASPTLLVGEMTVGGK
jgi:PmbA protein